MTHPALSYTLWPGLLSLPPIFHSPLGSVEPNLTELVALFPFPPLLCPHVCRALAFKSAWKCIFSTVLAISYLSLIHSYRLLVLSVWRCHITLLIYHLKWVRLKGSCITWVDHSNLMRGLKWFKDLPIRFKADVCDGAEIKNYVPNDSIVCPIN